MFLEFKLFITLNLADPLSARFVLITFKIFVLFNQPKNEITLKKYLLTLSNKVTQKRYFTF